MSPSTDDRARWGLRESATFDRPTIAAIQRAAETGIYDIRGWGAKRPLPHFDDLLFLGASMSRYPLEGYRERCGTDVVLGDRNAKHPLHLDIPVTIAGMSFGALSGPAKEALGRGASEAGTSTTTGDGGMTPEERGQSKHLVYQYLPSRYGMNPDDLRKADAIEVVLGQGAKPGGGGMLLGQKISPRVAGMRTLPEGIDQRSACRHPDWTGPDDLTIKINELREITDWEKPIYVKVGATRTYYDVKLAVHAGADVVVVDGMQGGTAATQDVFIEHVGIPTLAAIPLAVQALQELGVHRTGASGATGNGGVQLIVSGGIRSGADVAKALALGADAVAIGTAALIALGDNHPRYAAEYEKLGSAAGFYDDFQDGRDPAGITTQDPDLAARFDPVEGGRRLANYLRVLTMEAQTIARACGKAHVCHLEPEDLVAVTIEAAAMARVPLAGTNWIPGDVMATADVVIIGGGLEGAATAWALSQRGVTDVLVAERNTVGSGMTGKSSGIVRCHYGVSSLAAMAAVGLEVFEKPGDFLGDHATDIGFRQTGYVVGVGEPNVDALRKSLAAQRAVGVQTEEIGADEVTKLWPYADLSPFAAFGWEPRGGYGDAYQTAQAFAVTARAAGVRIRQGANVTELLLDGDKVTGIRLADGTAVSAGTVVVATGVWTRPFLARYGIDVPIRVVREQIVTISPGLDLGPVPVFSDLVSLQYVRPELGGEILFGNSDLAHCEEADPDDYLNRATDRFVDLTVEKVGTRFPGLPDAAITGSYAGCYDVTPDWNPVISTTGIDGLIVAAGFSGHGFKIAPAVGRLVADLVTDGRSADPRIPEADFRLARFADGTLLKSPYPYVGAGEMR